MSNENKQICPSLSCRSAVNQDNNVNEEIFCQKEKCAWYDKINNSCSVLSITNRLGVIERQIPVD